MYHHHDVFVYMNLLAWAHTHIWVANMKKPWVNPEVLGSNTVTSRTVRLRKLVFCRSQKAVDPTPPEKEMMLKFVSSR